MSWFPHGYSRSGSMWRSRPRRSCRPRFCPTPVRSRCGRQLTPAVRSALERLAHPGEAEGLLMESIRKAEGGGALARWYYHLQHLARRGWLCISVWASQERLATLTPISSSFVFPSPPRVSDRPYVLSRFAYMRSDGDALVLESPRAFSRLILHETRATALLHALARPPPTSDQGPVRPRSRPRRRRGVPAARPVHRRRHGRGGRRRRRDRRGRESRSAMLGISRSAVPRPQQRWANTTPPSAPRIVMRGSWIRRRQLSRRRRWK